MYAFDSHVHYLVPGEVFRRKEYKGFPKETHETMKEGMWDAQIDGAIVMPCIHNIEEVIYMPTRDLFQEHLDLIAAIEKDTTKEYHPFAIISPKVKKAEEKLEALVKKGFKGLKLHSILSGVPYSIKSYDFLLKKAEDLSIPVMFHTGWNLEGYERRSDPNLIEPFNCFSPQRKIYFAGKGCSFSSVSGLASDEYSVKPSGREFSSVVITT